MFALGQRDAAPMPARGFKLRQPPQATIALHLDRAGRVFSQTGRIAPRANMLHRGLQQARVCWALGLAVTSPEVVARDTWATSQRLKL